MHDAKRIEDEYEDEDDIPAGSPSRSDIVKDEIHHW
jgi:hypothetical protein